MKLTNEFFVAFIFGVAVCRPDRSKCSHEKREFLVASHASMIVLI
jgi:hypothetical protein